MADKSKDVVATGYDKIAGSYLQWTQSQTSPRQRYTKKFLDMLPPEPKVLELGCGPGLPTLRMLLDHGAHAIANDISEGQLRVAKSHCPEANFMPGDMTKLTFEDHSLNGVVSFFAIFHLPRDEQKRFVGKIFSWLKPGSPFVLNLGTTDAEEIRNEFLGHEMYWSSYDSEQNKAMLADAGFEILETEILEAGDGELKEDDPDYGIKFVWIVAGKPASST